MQGWQESLCQIASRVAAFSLSRNPGIHGSNCVMDRFCSDLSGLGLPPEFSWTGGLTK